MKKKTRNKFEQRIEKQLKKSKVKFSYESEKIPYVLMGKYIPDFVVLLASGKSYYIETKGYFRPEAKRKMAAVKKQHPDLDIRIVFYTNKKSDINWAIKHGFPYAVGDIPKDWFNV